MVVMISCAKIERSRGGVLLHQANQIADINGVGRERHGRERRKRCKIKKKKLQKRNKKKFKGWVG